MAGLKRYLLVGLVFVFLFACKKEEERKTALIDLGHHLFFDRNLSFNLTKSCASCHDPQFAFSDGYRRSATATGDVTLRNSPSLINAVLLRHLDAADPGITSLEEQHKRPLYATAPIELGAGANERLVEKRLREIPWYRDKFGSAFSDEKDPIALKNVIKAIAAYVETLKSENSRYDLYRSGNADAFTPDEKEGMRLFVSAKLKCANCHVPPYFTTAVSDLPVSRVYMNTGLMPDDTLDPGLEKVTGDRQDRGRFKVPSLRNVALTAPYMHNGSIASLEEVIDLYQKGGAVDERVRGFDLSGKEKKQLLDFLYALSDSTISTNPLFQRPKP